MNLPEFTQRFSTVEACLAHLEAVRWQKVPYCSHCGSARKIHRYSDGRRHKCADCGRVFRVTTGTIFGDSPLKLLPKWFLAIYLETTHSKGITSTQLAKHVGVTQRTAWFMLQRIRNAASTRGLHGPSDRHAEIDKIHVGDKGTKERGTHKRRQTKDTPARGIKAKSVIFGMKVSGEGVFANRVVSVKGEDIAPFDDLIECGMKQTARLTYREITS